MRGSAIVIAGLLSLAAAAEGQDASVEITEAALTKLVQRIGPFSDAGVYEPTTPAGGTGIFQKCEMLGWLDCPSQLGEPERRPLLKCRRKPSLKLQSGRVVSLAELPAVTVVEASEPAVTYEWWIENPAVTVSNGGMAFSANVRSRVGGQTGTITRTVPASIDWDPAGRQLRMNVSSFIVPLQSGSSKVTSVDVGQLYNLALPVQLQPLAVTLPDWSIRRTNPRLRSASTQYQVGRVVLSFDLGF